ncbi:MAG: hypothetical protein AB1547_16135, partial [Thermodesulfobacteriota bacterium]
ARSNDLRLLQTVSAASQNTTRPPAGGPALKEKRWLETFCGAIKWDDVAKSQEVSVESRGDWGTFFAAAKKLSRPSS